MEEERMMTLMLEALDGELTEAESAELGAYLQQDPALAQEWRAMLAVDTLFRLTPSLAPSHSLVNRTLARLPDPSANRWVVGTLFVTLLLLGLMPVIVFLWLSAQVGGSSLLELSTNSASQLVVLVQALLRAALSVLADVVRAQPAVWGWLAVMLGIILSWRTLYRQLTGEAMQPVLADFIRVWPGE